MKNYLFGLLLSFVSVKSCERKTNTCDCRLAGIWSGTYTVDQVQDQGKLPYNFVFKPDGSLITEGKGGDGITYYSSGNWQLEGNELKCTLKSINFPYGEVVQSANFRFDEQNCKLINGKWRDIEVGNNSGTYQLSQVK